MTDPAGDERAPDAPAGGERAAAAGAVHAVPTAIAEQARAWLEAGGGTPAPARDASTVLLLRESGAEAGKGELEVFMIMRVASMAFAPSVYVFPGGGVDARDADPSLPWAGPTPAEWARVLSAPGEDQARELVVAAAREVFEECGVLLAGPDAESVVADLTDPSWRAARARLVARELSFAELLISLGLVLRTDLLVAVDQWITPEFEPRRYDTRFFAAALPQGQHADDDTSEADHARWVRPSDLLDAVKDGSVSLFPPTQVRLADLVGHTEAPAYLAARRGPLRPILPVAFRREDGTYGVEARYAP